jgi:3-oxoacyl-[acyl-carrier-protein] synthase II
MQAGAPAGVDTARLRRMDRFGRAGFVAGSLALARSGFVRTQDVRADAGAVFGSAFGCRDSVVQHAALLRAVSRVEDLSPAVFAQTVHNSVTGELAIEWRLGGVSETLLSGPCAGLEAILLAARRIQAGAANLIVAGGAEGLNTVQTAAWEEKGVPLREAAAALVLERADSLGAREPLARVLGGTSFFEKDATAAAARLSGWVEEALGEAGPDLVLLASPDREGFAGRLPWASVAPREESLGASGPLAAAQTLLTGLRRLVLVVVRNPYGPVAACAFGPITGITRDAMLPQ